jgi:Cu-Zn family superoxide dismutase
MTMRTLVLPAAICFAGCALFAQHGSTTVELEDAHQSAQCDPPAFTSAGPHFNPDKKKHGLRNPDGPHAGDMNNFMVTDAGTAKTTVTDPRLNLGTDSHSVFSKGGTSLVIHAKADDMKTDPAGNSGDRIACGVITK